MKPRELEKPFVSKRKGNQNAQSGVYCIEKKNNNMGGNDYRNLESL